MESRSHGIVGSIPTALVDGGRVAVGEVAARRALGWAEYLRSHAGGSMPRARSWLRTVLASLLSVATRCVPPKEWRMTAQSELTKLTKPTFEEVLSGFVSFVGCRFGIFRGDRTPQAQAFDAADSDVIHPCIRPVEASASAKDCMSRTDKTDETQIRTQIFAAGLARRPASVLAGRASVLQT